MPMTSSKGISPTLIATPTLKQLCDFSNFCDYATIEQLSDYGNYERKSADGTEKAAHSLFWAWVAFVFGAKMG